MEEERVRNLFRGDVFVAVLDVSEPARKEGGVLGAGISALLISLETSSETIGFLGAKFCSVLVRGGCWKRTLLRGACSTSDCRVAAAPSGPAPA